MSREREMIDLLSVEWGTDSVQMRSKHTGLK